MAEYIDKEALRDALYGADAITMNGVKILNQFPAADVAPVVHCRDCKHRVEKWYSDKRMRRGGYQTQSCDIVENCDLGKDDDFCSRGERKTT